MARWYGPGDLDFVPAAPPTLVEGPAYAVHKGRLFLIGGYDATYTYLAVVQSYDWSTNAWTTHDPLPIPMASYVRGVSVGDWIYFEAWDDLEWYFRRYNPDTGVTEALAVSLANEHGLAVIDGVIYQGIASPTPYSYDIALNTWTAVAGSPVVTGLTNGGVVEHDGSIVAIGGGNAAATVWRFTPGFGWDQLPDLPAGATYPIAASYRGTIVAVGGYTNLVGPVATDAMWVLNETLTAWVSGIARAVPVGAGGGGAVDGRVITAGGMNTTTGLLETGTHLMGHEVSSVDAAIEIDSATLGPKATAYLNVQFEVTGGAGAEATLRLLLPVPEATTANLIATFEVPLEASAPDAPPAPGAAAPLIPPIPPILDPGMTPTERLQLALAGCDQYQLGYSLNGAVEGSVTRLRDATAATPPTDVPFLEGYTESAQWTRDAEVVIARAYYSATAEALGEPLDELMPAEDIDALLKGRSKEPVDANGDPIRWPLDADLCDADWIDPCDPEDQAARDAAIEALLPTRMQLATRAGEAAGLTALALHGDATIVGAYDLVEYTYRTEGKSALAVIGDMLLRGGAPYVITPGAMVVFGDGLPVGTGFAEPDPHTAGTLWSDSATDQGDVSVARNGPIVDPPAPVLQDFLDDLCGENEANAEANDTFETNYTGYLRWRETSGISSNPFEVVDPNYRETTTTVVKDQGRIVSETRSVRGYQLTPDGYRFTTIETYQASYSYVPCCPEALAVVTEATYVAKQFDQAIGAEGAAEDGTPSEDAVGFFEAMPDMYLESSRRVVQRWHAEGWLRSRFEHGTKFDGWEFSSEVTTGLGDYRNETSTDYEAVPTYSPSSRRERNVPVGGGVWMQNVSTTETVNVPKRERVRVPNSTGIGTMVVTEVVGSQRALAANSYTVMTDQAPPTVSCEGDPCGPATCEEEAQERYDAALAAWQETVAINAAKRLNAPQNTLSQRFTWNGHLQLRVGDVVTTDRGAARVVSVAWSGQGARAGSPGRTTSAEVRSGLPVV